MNNNTGLSRTTFEGGNNDRSGGGSGGNGGGVRGGSGSGGGGREGAAGNGENSNSNSNSNSRLVKRHLTTESAYAILDAHKLYRDAAARSGGDGEVRAAASSLAAKETNIRGSVEVRHRVDAARHDDDDRHRTHA